MKFYKGMVIFVLIIAWLMLETNPSMAQGEFSVLTGKVLGIRVGHWLNVQSEKDKAIVKFKIGYKTVYTPNRHPLPGERVKVEYWVQRGALVAYTINILKGSK